MPEFEIICLANSRKLGGRCVAGLRVDGSGWFRPVGTLQDGTLYPPNYTLDDGTPAGLLDVITVGARVQRPSSYLPENWVIDGSVWRLSSRPMGPQLVPLLRAAIAKGPELIRGYSDRVPYDSFQQQAATSSLALIAPNRIDLYPQISYRGKPQARGRFSLGPHSCATLYDLVITDPEWEATVIHQGTRTLWQTHGKFLITVSMGEPFGLNCYKLIAAITVLPPATAAVI